MNAQGEIGPRVGCVQRSSASTPTGDARAEVDDRLVGQGELVALDRLSQRGFQLDAVESEACISGSNNDQRPLPSAFA